MPGPRRYRLLCPIARALDRVGDRWTLILLRDLHAGPARFSDLQTLPGIASNLLTNRLRQLEDDGLVRRRTAEYGVTLYELTDLGAQTGELLFELASFGARFEPDEPVKQPGNLRTIAVTLQVACQRVVDSELTLRAQLVVDGEPFRFTVDAGKVDVRSGDAYDPEVTLETSYEPMVSFADGRMSIDELASSHLRFSGPNREKGRALGALLARAFSARP